MKTEESKYVLSVYINDSFVGYIKSYRSIRGSGYRFEKTKNIKNAIIYSLKSDCNRVKEKLELLRDKLYYNDSYSFEISKITDKEIRKSKLYVLSLYKQKIGIFKRS